MVKQLHYDSMVRLCGQALAAGAKREGHTRIVWDIAGRCEDHHVREIISRPEGRRFRQRRTLRGEAHVSRAVGVNAIFAPPTAVKTFQAKYVTVPKGARHLLVLELHTPCRKCDRCRRSRASLWRNRAVAETNAAPRTWFGTLTLRPGEQQRMRDQARMRTRSRSGDDFDALDYGKQFIAVHHECNREVTLMLKRIRKNSSAPLRYLVVCEQHKSGLPHFHCLIHEMDMTQPIRHALLSAQWRLGFSNWKLVEDTTSASYICKYLAKSSVARVRASGAYGAGITALAIGSRSRLNIGRVTPVDNQAP